jgi:hypothetical protein
MNSSRCCTAVFSKEEDVASVSGNIMLPTREYDKGTGRTERGYNYSPDVGFEDKNGNVKGDMFSALKSVQLSMAYSYQTVPNSTTN